METEDYRLGWELSILVLDYYNELVLECCIELVLECCIELVLEYCIELVLECCRVLVLGSSDIIVQVKSEERYRQEDSGSLSHMLAADT